ncbi:hypothetical protein E2C01_051078 [Portunus trituberculatus]|uniref:Uncharacterized protein n=1 Tax=Portunus trituberculatus TaxID=210409 RepID=A0A5B7GKU1_PORTR|nr:hypothetical protein [Portunus trituberculatus]
MTSPPLITNLFSAYPRLQPLSHTLTPPSSVKDNQPTQSDIQSGTFQGWAEDAGALYLPATTPVSTWGLGGGQVHSHSPDSSPSTPPTPLWWSGREPALTRPGHSNLATFYQSNHRPTRRNHLQKSRGST